MSYNLFPAPHTYPKEANINIKSMNTVWLIKNLEVFRIFELKNKRIPKYLDVTEHKKLVGGT